MKQLFLLVAAICLFSCYKEKKPILETVSGTWTIVETSTDASGIVQVQTYLPSSEFTMEFAPGGQLVLTGANPGQAASPLWNYDRYQVLPENMIRFYQSTGTQEIKAYFTVNGELFLNHLSTRCAHEEKFVRLK
ncbi:MAG TPA: hypothetical protein VMR70_12480 [Flavisolibacter sp.]|nr:hypothetical protein [Flavisolibacter sp.]